MKNISFKEFEAFDISRSVDVAIDNNDIVTSISRTSSNANDWIALPVREEVHTLEGRALEAYCDAKNIKNIIGFSPDYIETSEIFLGKPLVNNFLKIESSFALRPYVIVSDPEYFQIVSDGDYYTIFLGAPSFLENILGSTADSVIEEFRKYISNYKSNKSLQNNLSKVLQTCIVFNSTNI